MFLGTIPIAISWNTHAYARTHTHTASISVVNPTPAFSTQCLLPFQSKQERRNNCHFPLLIEQLGYFCVTEFYLLNRHCLLDLEL